MLVTTAAMAIPAKRGLWTTITLSDGTQVRVELRGDEHLHYLQATDGTCYVKSNGVYERVDAATLQARRVQRVSSRRVVYASTADGLGKFGQMSMGSLPSIGEYTIPVVMVQFSDMEFQNTTTVEKMTRYYNEEGYADEEGCVGSVRDYFKAQSGGMFVPTFDVVGIVTLDKSYKYYGAHDENDENIVDQHLDVLPGDVISAAVSQLGVDFSKYVVPAGDENHAEGVPLLAMFFAGPGEATEPWDTGGDYLWPCEWDGAEDPIAQGNYADVHFNSFFIGNELYTDRTLMGMGVFCHETGHALGLPDFYCTNYSYENDDPFGYWSIMDCGAYVNGGHAPVGYMAYEKSYLGWLELKEFGDAKEVTLQSPTGSAENSAYIIRSSDTETFIFENRQPSTWYPTFMGPGVMVSRIAYDQEQWAINTLNNIQDQKRALMLTADNVLIDFDTNVSPKNLYGNGVNSIQSLKTLSGDEQAVNISNIVKNDDGTITLTRTRINTAIASYMKPDGTTSTHEATVINQNNMPTTLGADGTETWYVVTADVSYTHQLDLYGDVNIIIADHKTMSAEASVASGNDLFIYARGNLTIYGQSLNREETGTLSYNGSLRGIFVNNTYTQNSGNISISSSYDGYSGYAFECGSMTVNGGSFTAESTGKYGIAILANNDITINGGIVSANGKELGISSVDGNLTLGWTNDTDRFTANNYVFGTGRTVSVVNKKALKDDSNNVYVGTLSNEQLTDLAGKTLQPATQTEYILAYLGAGNDGSAAKPYVINSIDGWNAFCLAIEDNATWNGFKDKTVVLGTSIGTADNPVTTMSGSVNNAFEGTFDGQGNTLTVNIANTDNALRTAPFSNVSRATVKNLIVAGKVTGTMGAGGIMGDTWYKSFITNCVSSVDISGGGYIGGLSCDGEVEITGCVFNGKIVGTNGGGFVGSASHDYPLAIKDCLLDPKDGSSISGGTFYHDDGCGVAPVNSYYTLALGTPQGTTPRDVIGDDDVIVSAVSPVGNATATYNVSGITAYAKGITRGEAFYFGNGDDVSLTLVASAIVPIGYCYSTYTASAGTLSGNNTDGWTLTMPDGDVTISGGTLVSDGQPHDVPYMKPDGTLGVASAISLDGTEGLGEVKVPLPSGTYFVGKDISYDRNINCYDKGEGLNIILGDGCTMDFVIKDVYACITAYVVNIYGQTAGTGVLNLTAYQDCGLYTAWNMTINGGTITASSGADYDAIRSDGDMTLNGGSVTGIHGGPWDAFRANNIYLNGSTVTANYGYAGTVHIGDGLIYTDGTTSSSDFSQLNLTKTLSLSGITPTNNADNTAILAAARGKTVDVTLSGRTLYKDGTWNTLCLPFDIADLTGTPLEGAIIRPLADAELTSDKLTLRFGAVVNAVTAGTPYLVKWGTTGDNLTNPTFNAVTVSSMTPATASFGTGDSQVEFIGTYSPVPLAKDDHTNLYMDSDNKLHYPTVDDFSVNAFQAYFKLGALAASAADLYVVMTFDGDIATSSEELSVKSDEGLALRPEGDSQFAPAQWYRLSGTRLNGHPTTKGLYIVNGKKVVK